MEPGEVPHHVAMDSQAPLSRCCDKIAIRECVCYTSYTVAANRPEHSFVSQEEMEVEDQPTQVSPSPPPALDRSGQSGALDLEELLRVCMCGVVPSAGKGIKKATGKSVPHPNQ